MNKVKIQKEEEAQQPKRKYRSLSATHTAQQKCEAILSLWSERRTPSQVCRELSITWTILNQWQERALEGMLQALEPRVVLDKGPALSPRLQAMLQKKRAQLPSVHLTARLKDLQQQNKPEPALTTVNGG